MIVEGETDRLALSSAARRLGRDLAAEHVDIVPIGGAHAIARFLSRLDRDDVEIAGLCDEREEDIFRRALEAAAFGSNLSPTELERIGFFVCRADLEDELIRAVGTDAIAAITEREGAARAWTTFRRQPAWQGQDPQQQFRRFIRSVSSRNGRYIVAMVDALEPDRLPRPLLGVLAYVERGAGERDRLGGAS